MEFFLKPQQESSFYPYFWTARQFSGSCNVCYIDSAAWMIVNLNPLTNLFLVSLNRYFPQGIDIYFDNVGGAMLDAALLNMRIHGRIAICGMVSQHSLSDLQGIHNLFSLITKRTRMQGFLQSDYLHIFPRFLEDVTSLYKQGKVVYIEDMHKGLESAPAAFVGLFSGENVGKQIICVAHE
ncbi:unnamed protein product [Ilex paraguariensis]|uniref:Alcohol dehydrogenase-like C-terminal domain-containing protein n=1 Tax=Ilex paraguariensis TaxID=185542 RepID=A0ABC8QQE6_9AQUA